MDNELTIALKLNRDECIRGESVFFEMTITNASPTPIRKFLPLKSDLRTVSLIARGAKGEVIADQRSADDRDGVYHHEPRSEPPTTILAPNKSVTLTGDLLEWFAELEPGRYEITGQHIFGAESQPVPLKILPAAAVFASTPRYAAQAPSAPFTGAWAHQEGEGLLLFYQHQSPTLPRNPRHGVRVANPKKEVEPHAAVMPVGEADTGHLIWLDPKNQLQVAAITIQDEAKVSGWEVQPPFKGRLLSSPLSMPDHRAFVPFAAEDRKKVAVLEIDAGGDVKIHEIGVSATQGLGPYVCLWQYDAWLHFCWTGANGREIQHARLPLHDTAAGFVTRSAHVSEEAILWIDGYLDTRAPARDAPYFEEQVPPERRGQVEMPPPPPLVLWCVSLTMAGLRCTRVDVVKNVSQVDQTLPTGGAKELRVLGSVVTNEDYHLGMLLAGEKDVLYFASTATRRFEPLEKLVKEPVTLESCPALITASRRGTSPWVYLRRIAPDKTVRYARLEPQDEEDPVERSAQAPTRRRRRR